MKAYRWMTWVLAAVLAAAVPHAASAADVKIKLATLVPDGSVWHKILLDLGDDWATATDGRVTMQIYPGGIAGDDPDVVRKMRIGQIHAGALTAIGLSAIDESFLLFGTPMFFDDYDELLAVLDKMGPVLEKRLDEKGFKFLCWGHAGWAYFFTTKPASTIEDMKKLKIFVWAGDDRVVKMWKDNGFQPVALAATDILTGLQTGMIDAMPTTPLAANALQWFRITPYMTDMGLAPLIGALVVSNRTWKKIAPADQEKILALCRKAEKEMAVQIPDQDARSLAEMKRRGLEVTPVSPAAAAEWRKAAEDFASKMAKDGMVPKEIVDLALRERNAYRKQSAGKSSP